MKRKVVVALLGVLLICAGAGLALHLDDYAKPAPAGTGDREYGIVTTLPAQMFSPELSTDATPSPPPPPPIASSNQSEPSLVGLPFQLSSSVRNHCQRSEGYCNELETFLERMAAEPRNTDWARAMESRIETAVLSGERGKYRIRALECRSTRCALEVASEVDSIGIQFDSDPAFDDLMIARPGYYASEIDPQTGIETLVSAQVWQTMESFEPESDAEE